MFGATGLSFFARTETFAGMSIAALRFFTVYGPRQRPDMAINRFTRLIADGEPVPVFGDGASKRDYTFVSDTVDGVVAALDDETPGYGVYNLGRGELLRIGSRRQSSPSRIGGRVNAAGRSRACTE